MESVNIYRCLLVKEREVEYEAVRNSESAINILKKIGIEKFAEEHVWMLALDCKGNVAGIHEISHGGISESAFYAGDVFKKALLNNAAAIILAHNHPSGDATPSSCDIEMTQKVIEIGKLLNVQLIDHIIAGETYVSMANEGYIN